MRKSQLDVKLDKDLQNTAKNHPIKTKIFDSEDISANNRQEDIEEQDKKNINLLILDLYSYITAITYMH